MDDDRTTAPPPARADAAFQDALSRQGLTLRGSVERDREYALTICGQLEDDQPLEALVEDIEIGTALGREAVGYVIGASAACYRPDQLSKLAAAGPAPTGTRVRPGLEDEAFRDALTRKGLTLGSSFDEARDYAYVICALLDAGEPVEDVIDAVRIGTRLPPHETAYVVAAAVACYAPERLPTLGQG